MIRKTLRPRQTNRSRRLTLESLERRDLLSFAAVPVHMLPGDNANDVAVENLNADGHLDLVVANGNGAAVLLGFGNGDFGSPTHYAASSAAVAVAISGVVAVFENVGDGTFQAGLNWSVGSDPKDVALGDLDNDGDLDIAVVQLTTITVLLNTGTGVFLGPFTFSGGGNSSSMALADFDSDSDLDIVVTNYNTGGTVSVIMGHGDGTFAASKRYRTGGKSPRNVSVGDFNIDGHPDLAVTNRGNNRLGVLLNQGDGNFGSPNFFVTGPAPYGIAAGDLNGDSRDDLAVTNNAAVGGVQAYLGNGDGTFQLPIHHATLRHAAAVEVGDFDEDGDVDLTLLTDPAPIRGAVEILSGNGNGAFRSTPMLSGLNSPAGGPESGDFNGDGVEDLVVREHPVGFAVFLANGNGTFQSPIITATGDTGPAAVGDFDADGYVDVIGINVTAHIVNVFMSNGDGTFQAPVDYLQGIESNAVVVTDVNGDAILDLVVTNFHLMFPTTASVLLGVGDGTFISGTGFEIPAYVNSGAAGDFNSDGRNDLVTAHSNFPFYGGSVSVYLGNGDGTFAPGVTYDAGGPAQDVVVGDFGNDGRLDIAVSRAATNFTTLNVLSGVGDGTFGAAVSYLTPEFASEIEARDFDGDGFDDLAVTVGYGLLSIYRGQASGTLQSPISFDAIGYSGSSLTAGDFNADGRPDLAAAMQTPAAVVLLMNDGAWPVPLPIGDGPASLVPRRSLGTPERQALSGDGNATAPIARRSLAAVRSQAEPGNEVDVIRVRPAVRYVNAARHDSLGDELSVELT